MATDGAGNALKDRVYRFQKNGRGRCYSERQSCITVQSPVSADGDKFDAILPQGASADKQLTSATWKIPTSQVGHQVFGTWMWVLVNAELLAYCDLVAATKAYGAIMLIRRHHFNGCCPLSMGYFLDTPISSRSFRSCSMPPFKA